MVENAFTSTLPLPQAKSHKKADANNQRRENMNVWPSVWIASPLESHTKEDEACSNKQASSLVHCPKFLCCSHCSLELTRRRVVAEEDAYKAEKVDGSADIPIYPPAVRVMFRKSIAHEDCNRSSQSAGYICCSLAITTVLPRQDFRRNSIG